MTTAQTINARTRQHVFPDVDRVEMAHHFIEVRGATFHVAEAGQGEPLLLIHGYPQHWWVWRRVIPHFAGERRVICPDLRGFGWSDAPPDGPYDKESLVDDVIALLDELEVGEVDVVGHDWGGWISYLLGMKYPDRVKRIVALSIMHPFQKPNLRLLGNLWHIWHGQLLGLPGIGVWAARPDSIAGRLIARWLGAGTWTKEERRIFLGQLDDPARHLATHRLYQAVRKVDMPRVLRGHWRRTRLQVPTRLIVGRRDPCLLPNRPDELKRYAPKLELKRVEAAHAVLEEQGERVLALIDEFLDGPMERALSRNGKEGS
jgi:pimeloyl-ACP methyl ester carboxylesterase